VPEGEVETFIDLLVRQGARVIFTTSFGYMDGTLKAAARHPDVIFAHASGFQRGPNVATYMADFYQLYYLNGLMAGALTSNGKVGYVGAFPIAEVKRHISAFARGVREVKPTAEVHVRWIFNWFNPAAAKEATEALMADGADVLAFTEDSPLPSTWYRDNWCIGTRSIRIFSAKSTLARIRQRIFRTWTTGGYWPKAPSNSAPSRGCR
jgi:simple sugar transport system substrate-binding protein